MSKTPSVVLITGFGRSRRLALIAALERHGYRALMAHDAFEALQLAIERKVDLLLAAEEMPGLTGRELIELVRKHQAIKHCVLVSNSDKTSADHTLAAFQVEQLLMKIQEVLPAAIEKEGVKSPAALGGCGLIQRACLSPFAIQELSLV